MSESWVQTVAPTAEPVTLAAARLHMRVGSAPDTAVGITLAADGAVLAADHGLSGDDQVIWSCPTGMVELDGVVTTIDVTSTSAFTIGVNTAAYTASDGTEQFTLIHPDDDLILDLITAARQQVEKDTNSALPTQTWRLSMDEFYLDEIEFPKPNLQSVTSVKYEDVAGDTQTYDDGNYTVDTDGVPGRLALVSGAIWPVTYGGINDVAIIFVCGYTTVPRALKQAILLLVGDYYNNREAQTDKPLSENLAYQRLVAPYKYHTYL